MKLWQEGIFDGIAFAVLILTLWILYGRLEELESQNKMLWSNIEIQRKINQEMVAWKIKNFGTGDEVLCCAQVEVFKDGL